MTAKHRKKKLPWILTRFENEYEAKRARKEIRRLRRMLRVVVVAGHYNPDCPCEACDATREVFAWDAKRKRKS